MEKCTQRVIWQAHRVSGSGPESCRKYTDKGASQMLTVCLAYFFTVFAGEYANRTIMPDGYMGPTNFTVLVEMMTKGYNIIRDVTKTIIGAIRTVKVLRAATKLAKEEDTESEEAGAF
ncbi:hypothetical protein FQN52_002707 [Onygenales sp. PD_12]|nr:hypothetical protein FQN52_002707 [Onygenales sp. PD_12]